MQLPDGTTSVLTQGRRRIQVLEVLPGRSYLRARGRAVDDSTPRTKETIALMRAVLTLFEKCVQLNRSLPDEAYVYAVNIEDPGWLADLIASALSLSVAERQAVLETFDPITRLQRIEHPARPRAGRARARGSNPQPGPDRGRPLAARDVPARTDEGDSDRAGRGRHLGPGTQPSCASSIAHLGLPEEVQVRALKEVSSA